MEAVRHLVRPTTVEQTTGRILRSEGAGFVVRSGNGELEARRAASCLLEPGPDDLVLLASTSTGEVYVLAVLERGSDGPAQLKLDSDLELHANGKLALHGKQGINLATEATLGLVARSLEAVAKEGNLLVRTLSVLSESLHTETGKLNLLAAAVDAVAERVHSKLGSVYRRVETLEQVRAGQVHLRVEGNLDLRGNNTLVTAQRLVKLNAEQVHMG